MKKKTIIIIGVVVVVLVIAGILLISSGKKEAQINTAVVEEKNIELSVTATGYLQPVDKVDVGTQVSGVIEKIFVDFNSHVKKGDLLAELDKSTLSEKLTQANASLVSSQSDLTYARQSYDRVKQLYDVKAATEASFEEAVNRLDQAKTAVANAKANVHQAQVNLSYAEIYSPIDGVVLDRSVDQGQTVAASFNTPTLFTIANDLKKMQVEADVDEADIGQVRLGQSVNFTVDAYTDETFQGLVNQIRLQPTVTSNVVTYTVIIEAPNPEEKLFPGMTASVTIITDSEKGIGIPTEALNFHPSADVMKELNIVPPQPGGPQSNGPHPGDIQSGGPQPSGKGVWVKNGETVVHRDIKTGLNDGVNVIISDGLKMGDTVILSASMEKKVKKTEEAASNPLMPKPPRR